MSIRLQGFTFKTVEGFKQKLGSLDESYDLKVAGADW